MKPRKAAKIAVIGAGMAGLTAAQKLLANGAQVTLIEKSHGPGGRASSVERDHFYLNQGPHALYKGGAAYGILNQLNITPAGAIPAPKRSLAIFQGDLLDLPLDAASTMATKLLSISDKIEWGFLMGNLAKSNLNSLQNVSLSQWLQSTVKSERVQELFTAMVRLSTYCNNPQKISAAAAIQQLLLAQQEGVLYLDHGWQSLVDSMLQLIRHQAQESQESQEEQDGQERKTRLSEIYGAEVTAIVPCKNEPGLNQSLDQLEITINGSRQNFDAVILAIPPKQVSKLLSLDSGATSLAATLDNILPSHAACLDVCLRKLTNNENTFARGIDQPLYYSVHSTTAKLAEDNHALIHLAVYLPEGEKGSEKHEHLLIELLDKMQPGWQEELVYKRFLPNMTASFGTPIAADNGANGLSNVTLPVVNLPDQVFVCGDWVGRGHLLVDAAMSSAVAAAEAAIAKIEERTYVNLA